MEKFETFLPVFKGTYGNYWDDYNPTDENGFDIPYERYELNFRAFLESIGRSMINWFESDTELFELAGIESMEFQSSHSPAYYNFSNDSINVSITIKNETRILLYILENWDYFKKRIKEEHTSRDGFNSNQSNDINKWKDETNGFTDFSDNEYYLGFLLDVICDIEGYEEKDAYWDWCEMANEEDFVTIEDVTWETINLDTAFRDNLDKIDFTYGDLVFLKEVADKRAELFSTDWVDEIEDEDKINLLEGLGLSPEQFEYVNN